MLFLYNKNDKFKREKRGIAEAAHTNYYFKFNYRKII